MEHYNDRMVVVIIQDAGSSYLLSLGGIINIPQIKSDCFVFIKNNLK